MENKLAKEIHITSISKGWWKNLESAIFQFADKDGNILVNKKLFTRMFLICKLALIQTEVAEAIEELRNEKINWFSKDEKTLKPEGFFSEIADIDIRLYDLIKALEMYHRMDYQKVLEMKAQYNKSRPFKHNRII